MTRGTFAIGAGYMNAFELMMRIAQSFAERYGIVQVFFISRSTQSAKHGQLCK